MKYFSAYREILFAPMDGNRWIVGKTFLSTAYDLNDSQRRVNRQETEDEDTG